MGSPQVWIYKKADDISWSEFLRNCRTFLYELVKDSDYEETEITVMNRDNFEELWKDQDYFKNTPEIKAKYKKLAEENKLVHLFVEW
jgi:hypothetical protein